MWLKVYSLQLQVVLKSELERTGFLSSFPPWSVHTLDFLNCSLLLVVDFPKVFNLFLPNVAIDSILAFLKSSCGLKCSEKLRGRCEHMTNAGWNMLVHRDNAAWLSTYGALIAILRFAWLAKQMLAISHECWLQNFETAINWRRRRGQRCIQSLGARVASKHYHFLFWFLHVKFRWCEIDNFQNAAAVSVEKKIKLQKQILLA